MQQYKIVDVQSASIKQIIWDYNKNLLMIKFNDSPIYVYPTAPKSLFDAFIKAESKGKFFMLNIRKQYPKFIRLDN